MTETILRPLTRYLIIVLIALFCGHFFSPSIRAENIDIQDQGETIAAKGQLLPAPVSLRSPRAVNRYDNHNYLSLPNKTEAADTAQDNLTSVPVMKTALPVVTGILIEGFEQGAPLWSTSGSWEAGEPAVGVGPEGGFESTHCAGTELPGNYIDNADDWLISPVIALPILNNSHSKLQLSYQEWFQLETDHDFGRVMISTDNGVSWTQLSQHSGDSQGWHKNTVELTMYQDQAVQIAFQLVSDEAATFSGWYIDTLRVDQIDPAPLAVSIISLNSQNFPYIYMNVAVDG